MGNRRLKSPAGGNGPCCSSATPCVHERRYMIGNPDNPSEVFEERVERFERAWRGGSAPSLFPFLADLPGDQAAFTHLALELIKIDLEYRWRRLRQDSTVTFDFEKVAASSDQEETLDGQLPDFPLLEDYLARLEGQLCLDAIPPDLICEEYRVRIRWGDGPSR
ncbi:MAG: hypothetical protein N2C14_31275, partial [Planctomycetales bacterium]